jgi:hypothetical protein
MKSPLTCPYLKEVVMLYCDACHVRKMVPLDHLASASPCLVQTYADCPLYQEVVLGNITDISPEEEEETPTAEPDGPDTEVHP